MKNKLSNFYWLNFTALLAAHHLSATSLYPKRWKQLGFDQNIYQEQRGSTAAVDSRTIKAAEYSDFLNTEAATAPYNLYEEKMGSDAIDACITREGSPGNYSYSVISGRENSSLPYLSPLAANYYYDWLTHKQTTVQQENSSIDFLTPTGTYIPDDTFSCNQTTFSLAIPSTSLSLFFDNTLEAVREASWKDDILVGGAIIAALAGGYYAYSRCLEEVPTYNDEETFTSAFTQKELLLIQDHNQPPRKSVSWNETVERKSQDHEGSSSLMTEKLSIAPYNWQKRFYQSQLNLDSYAQEQEAKKIKKIEELMLKKENSSKKAEEALQKAKEILDTLGSEENESFKNAQEMVIKAQNDYNQNAFDYFYTQNIYQKFRNPNFTLTWKNKEEWGAWADWASLHQNSFELCWRDWRKEGEKHHWLE